MTLKVHVWVCVPFWVKFSLHHTLTKHNFCADLTVRQRIFKLLYFSILLFQTHTAIWMSSKTNLLKQWRLYLRLNLNAAPSVYQLRVIKISSIHFNIPVNIFTTFGFCIYVILIENEETRGPPFFVKKHNRRNYFFEFHTFAPFLHTQCMDVENWHDIF